MKNLRIEMEENTKLEEFSPETRLAVNAVYANPDTEAVGLPPDGFRGLATMSTQRLQKVIACETYGELVDVYVVQWPCEPVSEFDSNVAQFVYGFGGPGYAQNVVKPVTGLPAWSGLATGLQIGGLCAYVMKRGQSPFPGPAGPYDPIETVRLVYDADMFHDNARLIGGFYEVINTTSSLYQQGQLTSASIENPTNEKVFVMLENIPTTFPGVRVIGGADFDQELMPFSGTEEMMKVPNSSSMAAKQGVYAPLRLNLEDNSPTLGLGYNSIFVGGGQYATGALSGDQRICLVYGNALGVRCTQQDNVINSVDCYGITGTAAKGKVYKTNACMQMSVFTGLSQQTALTVVRRATSHCLSATGSQYYGFAQYSSVPPNPDVMAGLQAAIDATPDFFESASNANGKAFKKLAGAFKGAMKKAKAASNSGLGKLVKDMVVSQAKTMLPPGVVANASNAAKVVRAVKRIKKAKKPKMKVKNSNQ